MNAAARASTERLDVLLVARGLAETRTKARALILAGRVRHGEVVLDKPGARIELDASIEVAPGRTEVGRGGRKLAGALEAFGVDLTGRDVLDIGSSTGGFTEASLRAGATRVLAVDVGRGQLDWSLRTDPRVTVLEGVNARYLDPGDLPCVPDVATIDVSFISLELVVPAVARCLAEAAQVVPLVKPQFEVGRRHVGKGGIVRDPELHRAALARAAHALRAAGLAVLDAIPSPIRGARGNVEFFLHGVRPEPPGGAPDPEARIRAAVTAAEETPS